MTQHNLIHLFISFPLNFVLDEAGIIVVVLKIYHNSSAAEEWMNPNQPPLGPLASHY